jgi:pimeloyl-ACP methyl ester carboxylesterase
MRKSPKPFERPVLVLGGYQDPGLGPAAVCARLRSIAGGQRIIGVSYFFDGTFDECRHDVLAEIERACPSPDPGQTQEVDVIGLSMGGVVARYCAIDKPGERRLRIHQLFTISSPHRGAAGATALPAMTRLHRDLCEGSAFLAALDAAEGAHRDYPIVPYVRLGDWIVGVRDAAPRGQSPWWVSTPPMENPHLGAPLDPRILADIVRRLRAEEPFTHPPTATLPAE